LFVCLEYRDIESRGVESYIQTIQLVFPCFRTFSSNRKSLILHFVMFFFLNYTVEMLTEVSEGEQRREAKVEEEKKRIYFRSYSQRVQ